MDTHDELNPLDLLRINRSWGGLEKVRSCWVHLLPDRYHRGSSTFFATHDVFKLH